MNLKALRCGRILMVAAVIFIGLVVTLICVGFDEPAYDDRALLPVSTREVALAPHKNAFYFYQQAQGKIQALGDNTRQRLKDMVEEKIPWDAHFAAQLLQQNHAAMALFEQGQRMPDMQLPLGKNPQDIENVPPSHSFFPALSSENLNILVCLKRLQIGVLMRQGKEQQALQEIFGLLQMARQFRKDDFINFAFSIGFQEKALDDLVALVQTSKLPPAVLQSTISRLEAYRLTAAPVVEVLKLDYQFNKALQDAVEKETMKDFVGVKSPKIFYFYLPNQTRRIRAQYFEQLIAGLEGPNWRPSHASIQPVEWWNVLWPNRFGRTLLDTSTPRWPDFPRSTLHIRNTRLSLIQTWIALKLYKAEHGQWPSTLNALTPRYLPKVPIDTLTGQPIQYDLEAGNIFSADKQAYESQLAMRFKPKH